MNYDRPDLLDRLAAEYVLGTLRGRARRRFNQLQRELPAARDAVAAWEARLNPLSSVVPATAPPGRVWDAIAARTDAKSQAPSTPRRWAWLKPALGFAVGAALSLGLVQLVPDRFVSLDRLAQREQTPARKVTSACSRTRTICHICS